MSSLDPHGRTGADDTLQETFEAIVLDWDGLGLRARDADLSELTGHIERLVGAGVHVIVVTDARFDAIVGPLRIGPHSRGRLIHRPTRDPDEGPHSDRPADWLADQGITGGLVLLCRGDTGASDNGDGRDAGWVDDFSGAVVAWVGTVSERVHQGAVHPEGGPPPLIEVLGDQLARRSSLRVPNIDVDPDWVVPLPIEPRRERVAESLGVIGNGSIGIRASLEEGGRGAHPLLLVNGVYARGGHLLPGPVWTGLERPGVAARHTGRRLLDLRGGTLVRMADAADDVRSMRFVSLAMPNVMALRAEAAEAHLTSGEPLRPPSEAVEFERGHRGPATTARTVSADAQVGVAARDRTVNVAGRRIIERLAIWSADPYGPVNLDDTYDQLSAMDAQGFDTLLAEHRASWAQRWKDAGVVIEGDPEAELAARFAVFHLLNAAADSGETAVGPRGLTGDAYAGHVMWDADVFVLPAMAALRPAAARAMLEYRIRRLPAARALAAAGGHAGARFPWESARYGGDVTPSSARGKHHELIPISTGPHEEHIVADVAWAAAHYSAWADDSALLAGAGRDLLIDTARYWASRIRTDAQGTGHIYGVMGPDEYHQPVDDNAYTNVMARWNLRFGADLLQPGDGEEPAVWRALADRLVDGWTPERGLYEQFAGYFGLEPLLISQVAPPPVAADILLGPSRVAASQLIKQPDVLMLHHLVPAEVEDGSLRPCLDFYGPRTAHGSSLSPAIHASLLAQVGEPERALALFRMAARLDLDDLTGTTSEGLHLANMGGVWQALAFGFMGARALAGTLEVNPSLPGAWSALGLTFRFGGNRVGIRAEHDRVTITCDERLQVKIADHAPRWCKPGSTIVFNDR